MKRSILIFAMVGMFSFLSSSELFAQLKLGYINSGRIMTEYEAFKNIAKTLQDLGAKYEKQLETMQKDLEQAGKEFENQQLLLSEERKLEKQRKLQEDYQKYLQHREEIFGQQGEIAKKRQELSDPIINKIQEILDSIGKKEDYDFIFDTVNGNIVFAKEEKYDLSDRVLKELEKSGVGL